MEKTWDVTIMKMGSIEVKANTEQEAITLVENMENYAEIKWEEDWKAVDACIMSLTEQ